MDQNFEQQNTQSGPKLAFSGNDADWIAFSFRLRARILGRSLDGLFKTPPELTAEQNKAVYAIIAGSLEKTAVEEHCRVPFGDGISLYESLLTRH